MRGWVHRHPLLTSLLLIVLVAGPGYLRVENIVDRLHSIDEEACDDRRDQALLLRDLIELSDDERGGFNLTGIESFDELDPATQRYLADLEAASKVAPNPSKFVENALALLNIPDCD